MGEQIFSVGTKNLTANDTGDFSVTGDTSGVSFSNDILTINGGNPTISMATEGASTTQRIEVTDAANIILAGVNINTDAGPALKITDNAAFNVNITLADDSENTLTTTAVTYAGLQKNGDSNVGTLTIQGESVGSGNLTVIGGPAAAGIGGGFINRDGNSSNITITGGTIIAKSVDFAYGAGAGLGGGYQGTGKNILISGGIVTASGEEGGAGIGGGDVGKGVDITISGGKVTATGGKWAAGIGGGGGSGTDGTGITISGGTVTATGGYQAAGIGGGLSGSGNNNSLDGDNVVIIAESGVSSRDALEGFSIIDQGLVFTKQGDSSNWDADMYSSTVEVTANVEFPTSLTIAATQKLTVGANAALTLASGATLIVSDGAELANEGTIFDATEASITNNGIITTKANFYLNQTDEMPYTFQYQTYKTGDTGGTYTNLPNPDVEAKRISDIRADKFSNWYYLDGEEKIAIKDGDNVLLNQHTFYEETVPAPDPGPEPTPGTPDGWVESDAGWQYVLNGEYLNDGWHYFEDEYGNHWYYFDSDTYIATSRWIWDDEYEGWYWVCSTGPMIENLWQWIDNAWYGFWWGGKMCQGWVWDTAYVAWYYCDDYTGRVACNEWAWDGAWYYFDQNCHMLTNTWVGDYWLNEHGMWV